MKQTISVLMFTFIFIHGIQTARGEECQDGCNHCNIWRDECYECKPGWTKDPQNSLKCILCGVQHCQSCPNDPEKCEQCFAGHFPIKRELPSETYIINCVICQVEFCTSCPNKVSQCEACEARLDLIENNTKCGYSKNFLLTILIAGGAFIVLIIGFFLMKNSHQNNILNCCSTCNNGQGQACTCLGIGLGCCLCKLCQTGDMNQACDSFNSCDTACFCKVVGGICVICKDCSWLSRD